MADNFWKKLGRPILALAPLAGFTDSSFRQICQRFGADVLYSEMASAAALYYLNQGKGKREGNETLKLLAFDPAREKNYVVQLFGSEPEHFSAAACLVTEEIKPAGIDINFGCPVPKILKQGAGAGLMKDLGRSRAVVEAVIANTDRPVSVKIRAKSGEVGAEEFMRNIQDLPVSAVMIHGRSLAQGFSGAADFSAAERIREFFSGVILVNGGLDSLDSAHRALAESRADGLGLARGVLGRPWLFREIKEDKEINLSPSEIFSLAMEQAVLVQEKKGREGIVELRKHLAWYARGLAGASRLRSALVKVESLGDIKKAFNAYNL